MLTDNRPEIVKFISARLAEDAQTALTASDLRQDSYHADAEAHRGWQHRPDRDGVYFTDGCEVFQGACYGQTQLDERYGEHIGRHSPGRVLADVAAGRRELELFMQLGETIFDGPIWLAAEAMIKTRAGAWNTHPDYSEAWR